MGSRAAAGSVLKHGENSGPVCVSAASLGRISGIMWAAGQLLGVCLSTVETVNLFVSPLLAWAGFKA
eukprot:scaffold87102_cov19-Tisochrysis_lutea.AAC.2